MFKTEKELEQTIVEMKKLHNGEQSLAGGKVLCDPTIYTRKTLANYIKCLYVCVCVLCVNC